MHKERLNTLGFSEVEPRFAEKARRERELLERKKRQELIESADGLKINPEKNKFGIFKIQTHIFSKEKERFNESITVEVGTGGNHFEIEKIKTNSDFGDVTKVFINGYVVGWIDKDKTMRFIGEVENVDIDGLKNGTAKEIRFIATDSEYCPHEILAGDKHLDYITEKGYEILHNQEMTCDSLKEIAEDAINQKDYTMNINQRN